MRPYSRLANVLGLLALFVAGIPSYAFAAANISLTPATGSYGVGKTFTVQVTVDSGSDTFNSGNASISFDKEFLSVQKVTKEGSAFSLWAVEPASNNSAGTVTFEGGNTSPISGKKSVLGITFKALKEGKAEVKFTSASILAADGKGTDIAGEKIGATYDISASVKEDPPPADTGPAPTSGITIPLPDAPQITSPTHAEENKWYNAAKAKFVWDLPADITVVRLSLDKKPDTTPTTAYDPAISDKEFDTLENGPMYFHLRYKNDAGWGPTAHRKIQVDKDPPPAFTLDAVDPKEGGVVTLKFMATDTLSGIDRYEISVDDGTPAKIGPGEAKESGYELSSQTPGEHGVSVKAFDKAGNSAEAQAKFTIPGVVQTPGAQGEPEEKPTDWKLIWVVILVGCAGFLAGYIVYERKSFTHEKYVAKRESDEVRDTVANIFSALGEEIDEQVGQLFQKPNPSAQDRQVMEKINEALDLSEELIAKEVEDVRKLLM